MYQSIKISSVILIFFLFSNFLHGQYVPTHISNNGIYTFLDELAGRQIIDLNTTFKPYSRLLILEKLEEAKEKQDQLTTRQLSELNFYLKDYSFSSSISTVSPSPSSSWLWINKPKSQRLNIFAYKDSLFHITANPILGTNIWSNENGTFHHWWNGIETYASYGRFSLFASLRDNHESVELTNRNFMNQRSGGANIKRFSGGNRDYEEIRAGMSYGWEWGHIGLLMDQFTWGDANNGSNIFSGRTPPFTRIDLQMNPVDWFQFNYVHGWLVSEVVDSTLSFWVNNSYGPEYREVYHPKFLAANMFTFEPFKHFYFGLGNSIIYDYPAPHAAFFVPVMFWKSLDHTLNANIDNMNSQVFFTASSRNIKGIHIYSAAFIDEIQIGRIFREGEYNFTSFKAGITSYQLSVVSLTFEYTWSNALVFQHFVPTTTFESNQYNLGHFLEDNARDIYAAIEVKPWKTLRIKGYYNYSQKGLDHTLLGTSPRTMLTPLEPIVWESKRIGFLASMQLINDLYIRLGYEWRDVSGEQEWIDLWTPEVYQGTTGTWKVGVNYGF